MITTPDKALTSAVEVLAPLYDPDKGWYSVVDCTRGVTGGRTWNGWTGAKKVLQDRLGRRLTTMEISILSLSLDVGPTPALDYATAVAVQAELWPDGNPYVLSLPPAVVAEAIIQIKRGLKP